MDSGNEYVIQVKRNQKSLYKGVKQIVKKGKVLDGYKKAETNRGRKETRTVRLFANDGSDIPFGWKNVNRIIEVINQGKRDGHKYLEKHYYISSLTSNSADVFAIGIRSHWSIENNLHRVKDVVQNEDASMIRERRISANLSLMKSVAINLFRINGYNSIKYALERFRNNVPACLQLMEISPILKN